MHWLLQQLMLHSQAWMIKKWLIVEMMRKMSKWTEIKPWQESWKKVEFLILLSIYSLLPSLDTSRFLFLSIQVFKNSSIPSSSSLLSSAIQRGFNHSFRPTHLNGAITIMEKIHYGNISSWKKFITEIFHHGKKFITSSSHEKSHFFPSVSFLIKMRSKGDQSVSQTKIRIICIEYNHTQILSELCSEYHISKHISSILYEHISINQ